MVVLQHLIVGCCNNRMYWMDGDSGAAKEGGCEPAYLSLFFFVLCLFGVAA